MHDRGIPVAGGRNVLDGSGAPCLARTQRAALGWFLSDAQSTAALLSTIAGSLITVTSITITLLLIAVQQSVGMMTA